MVELLPEDAYQRVKGLVEEGDGVPGDTRPVDIGPWLALQQMLRSAEPMGPGGGR